MLILIRGLPGSGKSTLAERVAVELRRTGEAQAFEADQFFTAADGTYCYDRSKIKEAHEDCQRRVCEYLEGHPERTALVANTFTRLWEMEPYEKISREVCGMEPLIWRLQADFGSTHDVPPEKMEEMAARFEHHPREHLIVPTEITE